MSQHITKGHREQWTYYIGVLHRPTKDDDLSPEEQLVITYLLQHSGVGVKAKLLQETQVSSNLVENLVARGLLWSHSVKRSLSGSLPHGDVRIVVAGTSIPDNSNRVTVTDEESYNKALELIAKGPVVISTKHRMYTIDDFDQAAEIVSDQLIQVGYALVEVAKPKTLQPVKTTLDRPLPSYSSGDALTVHVTDDKSFEKALELVTKGPVTITAKSLKYANMTDFDKVADRLVYLLNLGYHPWVDGRKL